MRQQPNPQVRCKVFLVCGMMSDEHEKGIPNKTVDTHCAGPFVQPPPTHTPTHTLFNHRSKRAKMFQLNAYIFMDLIIVCTKIQTHTHKTSSTTSSNSHSVSLLLCDLQKGKFNL